ncbi:MAG: tetratricopeptide repeat protein [Sphaerochaetaceae bacterium]
MAKTKEESSKGKLEQKFATFVKSNQVAIIVVVAAIVLALVVLGIALRISNNQATARQVEIDALQRDYEQWKGAKDEDNAELKAKLLALSKRGGKSYPVVKALYLQGLLAYEEGAYEEANGSFLAAAERNKESYLAPLALFNAAVCSEQLGDNLKAIELYQRIYDDYGSDAVESPRALFSLARLYENDGELDLAKAIFQQLSDEFPASEFGRLAKTKLVIIQ